MQHIPSEIINLLKSDSTQKNFRVVFPNGEHEDITNDNIVSESVSFTESVCSQNSLKYGLTEASTLSFDTVGIGNIKGSVIDAQIEVDATDLLYAYNTVLDSSCNNIELVLLKGQCIRIVTSESATISYSYTMYDANSSSYGKIGTLTSVTDKIVTFDELADMASALDVVRVEISYTLLGTANGKTAKVYVSKVPTQTSIGTVDLNGTNSLTFTLEAGQGFKWTCDATPYVLGTITAYNIEGNARTTQTNYAFQTSLDSDVYTMADMADVIGNSDTAYVTVTLSLDSDSPETQINVYLVSNAYDYYSYSADVGIYYPIKYGRFYVDSCKRDGELQQRKVECYTYGSAGFQQQLFDVLEQGTWPVNTFTVNQPEVLLASYLFPKGIPTRYISYSSDISPTSGTFEGDFNDTYILMHDGAGWNSAIPTIQMHINSTSVVNTYDISSIPSVSDRLVQIKVNKSSNYDTYMDTMVAEALAFIRSTGLTNYTHNLTGETVYYDDEDAMRCIIEEMLRPKVTSGGAVTISGTDYDYHTVTSALDVGTQVLYAQQYSSYKTTTGKYTAWMSLFDTVKVFGNSSIYMYSNELSEEKIITVPGQLYEVEYVRALGVSNFVKDKYDDMTFTYNYTGSRSFSCESATHTYYKFDIGSDLTSLCDSMLEINGQFLSCGRDTSNEVITLSEDSMETIDAGLYSSLWYDDESIPRLKGAVFQYNNGTTDITDTYGNVPYYDLTSNEIIQRTYAVNSSVSDVNSFLVSNFMDNVFMSAYMPYTLTCVGLPYLEAGDYITVQDSNNNEFGTYIMRQTISGIQHLTSTLEAQAIDL